MQFPLVVFSDADVRAFATLDALRRNLEAIDVHNDEYECFDVKGRKIELLTVRGEIVLSPSDQHLEMELFAKRIRKEVLRGDPLAMPADGDSASVVQWVRGRAVR